MLKMRLSKTDEPQRRGRQSPWLGSIGRWAGSKHIITHVSCQSFPTQPSQPKNKPDEQSKLAHQAYTKKEWRIDPRDDSGQSTRPVAESTSDLPWTWALYL